MNKDNVSINSLIVDPPREPVLNESMTVQEGTSLALHCSTQGSPAPTLTWLKDGELVGTITADELSVLEIIEITPQGDGQYRCLAENEHGRASSSLNITVECECFTVFHLDFGIFGCLVINLCKIAQSFHRCPRPSGGVKVHCGEGGCPMRLHGHGKP